MKILNTDFHYDTETYQAICTLTDPASNLSWRGYATCHPNDLDMESERTGMHIAETRALIKVLKAERREVKIKIKEITDFYNGLKDSKKIVVTTDYVMGKIRSRLGALNDELREVNEEITYLQFSLNDYIKSKDELYHKIRKLRSNHA